jgi:putative transposase
MPEKSVQNRVGQSVKHATPETRRWINIGDRVWHRGQLAHVHSVGDLDSCVIIDSVSGQAHAVKLADLTTNPPSTQPAEEVRPKTPRVLEEDDLEVAQARFKLIEPLLHSDPRHEKSAVKSRARAVRVHFTTLYRYLNLYRQDGDLSALAPKRRRGRRDLRIDKAVEAIVAAAIDEVFIRGKSSTRRLNKVIRQRCTANGLPVPHKNTVRRRLLERDAREVAEKRLGHTAELAMRMVKGGDPRATQPLRLVQMDHTLLPVYVSRKHLKPFRPWLTLVLDVYSRMVLGFALTFKGPSANTVSIALTHAFLPKDEFLKKHDIPGEWPCWGLMDILSCDNGSDFRGKVLKKVCESPRYNIVQDFRPVAQPQYGAHIERLARTLKSYVRDIVGALGSTRRQRPPTKYKDEDLFTLGELEGWITELIVSVYHTSHHSELGMTPLERFRQGIHGTSDQPGRGVPQLLSPTAVKRLRLDFLPSEPRTIGRQGISLNAIKYSSLALEPLFDAATARGSQRSRKLDVRFDPADVRAVYVLDPATDEYLTVPSADPLPAVSLLDYKKSKKVDNSVTIAGEDRLDAREQQVKQRAHQERKARRTTTTTVDVTPPPLPKPETSVQAKLRTASGARYTDVRLPSEGGRGGK